MISEGRAVDRHALDVERDLRFRRLRPSPRVSCRGLDERHDAMPWDRGV
jgi:hypothetical protein